MLFFSPLPNPPPRWQTSPATVTTKPPRADRPAGALGGEVERRADRQGATALEYPAVTLADGNPAMPVRAAEQQDAVCFHQPAQ